MKKYNSIKELFDDNIDIYNILKENVDRESLIYAIFYAAIRISNHSFVDKLKEGYLININTEHNFVNIYFCDIKNDMLRHLAYIGIFTKTGFDKSACNYQVSNDYVTKIFNQINDLVDKIIDFLKNFEMSDDYGKVKANTCRTESL